MTGRFADNRRTDSLSSLGGTAVVAPCLGSENRTASARASLDALMSLLSRQDDGRLLTIYELLLDTAGKEEPRSLLYREGSIRAAEALLSNPFRTDSRRSTTGLAPWQLKRSITLMQQRSPARVEIEELADLVGISAGHFSRAFKASMGLSPYRWQLVIRMKQAQVLLLKKHLAVEDIADRVGFFDSAHFTRMFKKIVGVTPGSWRKNAAGQN